MAGIAGGAEAVCLPEASQSLEAIVALVSDAYVRGKQHCIINVAQGADPDAVAIRDHLSARAQETGFGVELCAIAQIQRGGVPSAHDRFLATVLGAEAVRALAEGQSGVLVGMQAGELARTPLPEVAGCVRPVSPADIELARVLAQ